MPAMGLERVTVPATPAGVTLYKPQIWNKKTQGDTDEGVVPQDEYISILTVNITYLSYRVCKWLGKLPYDILMVQEHRKHNKQGMGNIQGYSMFFSPAQITHTRKRKRSAGESITREEGWP